MADTQPTFSQPEEWRPVPGYEGIYEVSDHGRLRSLDRMVRTKWGSRRQAGRLMKLNPTAKWGYLQASLRDSEGNGRNGLIHRLVLEAFVGPCPGGMEACHNDGDPTNNSVENLRWDTRSRNVADRKIHGTDHQLKKTHCPRGHSLAEPNNTAWSRRQGHRKCLACSRVQGRLRDRPDLRPRFQELADSYFEQIMKGA